MNIIKKFKIGSNAFFDTFDDFKSKDNDVLCIMNDWLVDNTNVLKTKTNNDDVFYFKNMTLQQFIDDTLNCDTPMRVGKFLVPEFAQHLNMTIDDLKILEPLFDKLDDNHKYEKIIYDSYIENNGFYMTKIQLQKAYDEYKRYRGQNTI